MSEKLKPCPHCGSPLKTSADLRRNKVKRGRLWLVWCPGCGAEGPHAASSAEAIHLWNTRKDASHE